MPRSLRGLGEVWFVIAVILMLTIFSYFGHAATASVKHQSNSLGFIPYQDNPNEYLMGYVSRADVAEFGKHNIFVLEVRSTNTYQMFSQQLQICEDMPEAVFQKLNDAVEHRSVVVFTYSRVRHQRDCNDLYRVDEVKGVQ